MIKYQHAKGSNGNPVDVKGLTEETRRTNAPYTCYGCDKELIAVLPKKNTVKHFKHKSVGDCSGETCLHKLGKAVFISEYKDCLENNRPFDFTFQRLANCNFYADQFGKLCVTTEQKYPLTKDFTVIEEEKQVGDFRPDILLSTEDGTEKIFVEIAVTHPCEQHKINSGYRIIELKLAGEDDVTPIKDHKLKESDERITTYNLNKKDRTGNICNGNCPRTVYVFVIYENGESTMLEQLLKDALNPSSIRGKVKCKEIVGFADYYGESEGFPTKDCLHIDKIRETHFKRFHVKNCYLCKDHKLDKSRKMVFCKTYEKHCDSNEAVECDRFTAFRNLAECIDADWANSGYDRESFRFF